MKPKFNWKEVKGIIVILKNGRKVKLIKREVGEIVSAIILAAVHGF